MSAQKTGHSLFESYTKMWDADTFSKYFDPEGTEEIMDNTDFV